MANESDDQLEGCNCSLRKIVAEVGQDGNTLGRKYGATTSRFVMSVTLVSLQAFIAIFLHYLHLLSYFIILYMSNTLSSSCPWTYVQNGSWSTGGCGRGLPGPTPLEDILFKERHLRLSNPRRNHSVPQYLI